MRNMKKAFTMVELVGVIILLGLIASFMVPAFMSDNASSQSKVLASKIMTDLQAIEMKNNECYDTTGSWLTTSAGGASLTSTYVNVNALYCNGVLIEGNNRFFTPKPASGMGVYQMALNGTKLSIKSAWGATLNKVTQNAITTMVGQISTSKLDGDTSGGGAGTAIDPAAASGAVVYYITK